MTTRRRNNQSSGTGAAANNPQSLMEMFLIQQQLQASREREERAADREEERRRDRERMDMWMGIIAAGLGALNNNSSVGRRLFENINHTQDNTRNGHEHDGSVEEE